MEPSFCHIRTIIRTSIPYYNAKTGSENEKYFISFWLPVAV